MLEKGNTTPNHNQSVLLQISMSVRRLCVIVREMVCASGQYACCSMAGLLIPLAELGSTAQMNV